MKPEVSVNCQRVAPEIAATYNTRSVCPYLVTEINLGVLNVEYFLDADSDVLRAYRDQLLAAAGEINKAITTLER